MGFECTQQVKGVFLGSRRIAELDHGGQLAHCLAEAFQIVAVLGQWMEGMRKPGQARRLFNARPELAFDLLCSAKTILVKAAK
jgi:hypothetical protein